MKLKEWLKSVMGPVFTKPEELDTFLSASDMKEIEVPEEIQKAFNTKYMTLDRAMADENVLRQVQKNVRGMVFGSVDQKLKKLLPKLSAEDQEKINAENDTLVKLELFDKALDNISKSEDVKKVNEVFRKKEEELHEQIKGLSTQLSEREKNFKEEVKNVKLDFALRQRVAGFKLAPEFDNEKHRNYLAEMVTHTIKKQYALDFDEKEPSNILLRKNVDGALTDVYDGNTKLTIDSVLQKEYEPYVLKNNSGNPPPNPDTPRTQHVPTGEAKPVTLRDMQRTGGNVPVV